MDTVPLLPGNSSSLPALLRWSSGGLRLMNGASCLSDPLHFIPDRLQVCGRGGIQAGVNDRALFSAGTLVRIGLSQTITGVTGPQRPRVRGLMS